MDILNNSHIASMIGGFAILGTVIGVIIKCWSSIRQFYFNLTGILLVRVKLEDTTTSKAVLSYLIKKYKRQSPIEQTISGKHENFRNGQYGLIPYEVLGDKSIMFWNGWFPFWFVVKEQNENADKGAMYFCWEKPKVPKEASITYLRYTLNIDDIIKESAKVRNDIYWKSSGQNINKRFFIKKIPNPEKDIFENNAPSADLEWFNEGIYRVIGTDKSSIGKSYNLQDGEQATNNLFFPDNVTDVIKEVKIWHTLKDWYMSRNIPWKRGICLYGPPGTGKTALVRAIAEDLDMPLFVYSLGRMLDKDLELSWNYMQAHTPCIALFEDFDTVFHGRENVYGKASLLDKLEQSSIKNIGEKVNDSNSVNTGKLSFGCLLNCMDGVDKTNGIFTIITTNHIDKLDIALGQPKNNDDGTLDFISTRPGRIDAAVELGYMRTIDKLKLASNIFRDDKDGFNIMCNSVLNKYTQDTPAQFQEKCAKLALQKMWEKQKCLK